MDVSDLTDHAHLEGTPEMPALGLASSSEGPYCVYVLRCGEVYYVGIDFWADASERIRAHFRGEGSDFTKHYPPTKVCMFLRVMSRAAEAYVYYALLDAKPDTLVGGWTQTSWNPSPLVCLLTREARANLQGRCFNCDQKQHFAKDCPRGAGCQKTCWYPCKARGCGERVYITTRGQTPREMAWRAKSLAVEGDGDDTARSSGGGRGGEDGNDDRNRGDRGGGGSSSNSSAPGQAALAPTSVAVGAQDSCKRQRVVGKQTPSGQAPSGPDVSFGSAWFAARKHDRSGGGLDELASIRDIISLMKTRKSAAAVRHVDERLSVWMRRYGRADPKDCEQGIAAFGSKQGGGCGGAGVTMGFAMEIWDEVA